MLYYKKYLIPGPGSEVKSTLPGGVEDDEAAEAEAEGSTVGNRAGDSKEKNAFMKADRDSQEEEEHLDGKTTPNLGRRPRLTDVALKVCLSVSHGKL